MRDDPRPRSGKRAVVELIVAGTYPGPTSVNAGPWPHTRAGGFQREGIAMAGPKFSGGGMAKCV